MNEEDFLYSLKEYLQYDGEQELLQLLVNAEINFDKTNEFTQKSWQFQEYIDIRIPISLMRDVKQYKEYLFKICSDLYVETDEYDFYGINFKPLMQINKDNNMGRIVNPSIIYDNFINKVAVHDYDEIEKTYIIEACQCAKNGNMLAAATMLGCAVERLLMLLSNAYLEYLKHANESQREIDNFKKQVVDTDKAHKRLDGLYKYTQNKEKIFESLGFEKSNLHFSFLDFIRQVRNDSGHPTGNYVLKSDLNTIFSQYQLLYGKLHDLIIQLQHSE